jgi:hypothetical protein
VEREKDGQKTQFQVDLKIGGAAFESSQTGVVTAHWEGETLVIRNVVNPGTDRQTGHVERWVHSSDGTKVTDNYSAQLPHGKEVKITRVFVR